jgi:hypothetical protein
MKMNQHSKQRPVVGGIYRDKSGSSLVVLNVIGDTILLEYANGTVASVNARNWQQILAQKAAY